MDQLNRPVQVNRQNRRQLSDRQPEELTADEAATIRRELAPNMSRYGYV